MRAIQILLASVLVTASAVAQSSSSASSSQSGSTGTGSQTSDPNQQPTSPLQEPVKPIEAEQNKPKASTFDLGSATGSGQDQQLGEIRLMDRYTEVNGKTDS